MLDVMAFRRALRREKALADRSGLGFCLAIIEYPQPFSGEYVPALGGACRGRLRQTDLWGSIAPGQFGIILALAEPHGAHRVVGELLKRLPLSSEPLSYRVHYYPTGWLGAEPDVSESSTAIESWGDSAGEWKTSLDSDALEDAEPLTGAVGEQARGRVDSAHSGVAAAEHGAAEPELADEELEGGPAEGGAISDARLAGRVTAASGLTEERGRGLSRQGADLSLAPLARHGLWLKATPWWKRTMDVVGAGCGLIMLSPVMLVIAVLIRLSSPGPILFRQMRTGHGGRPFEIIKFRSMVVNAERQRAALARLSEQDGPAFKLRHDPRVTTIGRILRATSLDELPQLWNVFRGDMSLVGPRPLPCFEAEACQPWQQERHTIKPGLTCIWQVYGRSRVTFDEWMRMDLQYVRSMSPWHDLKLIVRTALALVTKRDGC